MGNVIKGAAPASAASTPSLFGSTPSAGLFGGQNASSGGLFGASSANAAGSLFGGSAASSPSPSLFGAGAGGGLFGASSAASGGGLFGAPAPASSGGLFGTPAQSSGGLFGGQAATSGGGLFGAASSGGGLFGASSAGGASLFGGGAASSSSLFAPSSSGLFGAASGGGLFGASSGQLALGGQPAAASQGASAATSQAYDPARLQQIAHEQASLFSSLKEYDAAFSPTGGRLTRLFLYVLDPSQHARPPNIPEAQWQFAMRKAGGPKNVAKRWPVAVQGMGQLQAHQAAQSQGAAANRAYLSELRAAITRMDAAEEHDLRQRAQRILQTHAELAHRLLKVVRLVDALEARVVSTASPSALYAKLHTLAEKLHFLEAQLAPNDVKGLRHAVDALTAAVNLQASVAAAAPASSAGVGVRTLSSAASLLGEHNRGIGSLQDHLRRIERDVALVTESARGPEMLVATQQ